MGGSPPSLSIPSVHKLGSNTMSYKFRKTVLKLAVASLATFVATLSSISPSSAAEFCQCVKFVENYEGNWIRGDGATNMDEGGLQEAGYTQVDPQPGAVVVMKVGHPKADPNWGHTGIVSAVNGDTITIRNSNYGGHETEADCNNVSTINIQNIPGLTTFWMKGGSSQSYNPAPDTPTSNDGNINYTNFSGSVMSSNGINLRNSPSLNDRSGENVAYQQNLDFDAWTTGDTVNDLQTGSPDSRWFRVSGTDRWVPSGWIYGNP
jgi:CHAP domain